ncbi:hypothetical protein KVV02_006192 [Mortierella alpina]|uniref:Uncharacterized protein n=1 Tax=Mortierella alpina TaxID=64518 RepID=A0A9P8D0D9_MORAP|nr:hypothetical protein KVV02_006192 [Mortierella alpina]
MTFFKITKKNKTASAANTPSQTPRTSIHLNASDVAAVNKNTVRTPESALEMLSQKGSLGHMQALSMARM